ncbi:MAG TPA: hypothetical protein VNA68_01385 [Candidatus Dormibacteraeota bacterium]|nr:hypothetical protein [Candidatus Dormibacteraeota bacterium]
MNSFFASVEQQENPQLRGKPVGVCPFVGDATCVIAASYEAKRYGVKTGTNIAKARRLCPHIQLVENNARLYRDYHRRIMSALEQTRCQVRVQSIDEALLLVPRDLLGEGLKLAEEVKNIIRTIGSHLQCSVGIASNRFLAKMATNIYKPNGLIEIKLEDLEGFYSILKLTDLHGISWRMARRLGSMGIQTPLDFYQAPYSLLKSRLGVNGERWYLRLRGYEVDLAVTKRRMIGHQNTIIPRPASTTGEVLSVASRLTYKAAVRLRASGLAAQSVTVYVRFADRSYWGKTLKTRSPFFDSSTFFAHVQKILAGWSPPRPVRLVSVTATDLIPIQATTLRLFDPTDKAEKLSEALDEIDLRFGRNTIKPARQLLGGKIIDQVGFGNAPDTALALKS